MGGLKWQESEVSQLAEMQYVANIAGGDHLTWEGLVRDLRKQAARRRGMNLMVQRGGLVADRLCINEVTIRWRVY